MLSRNCGKMVTFILDGCMKEKNGLTRLIGWLLAERLSGIHLNTRVFATNLECSMDYDRRYIKKEPCIYCDGEVIRKRYPSNRKLECSTQWDRRDWCHKKKCADKANNECIQAALKELRRKRMEAVKSRIQQFKESMTIGDQWLYGVQI